MSESDRERQNRWERLDYARRQIEDKMRSLADNVFAPGVKLTFVMRNPAEPDGGMIVTDEADPDDLIEAIRTTWRKR